MLISETPREIPNIAVARERVELIVSEDESSPLTYLLTPVEDIGEVQSLVGMGYSIKEYAHDFTQRYSAAFEEELTRLAGKAHKYEDSAVLHNRMANLAAINKDYANEAIYLDRAQHTSNDIFFKHRIGENFLSRGMTNEAKKIFGSLNLDDDFYAILRFASLMVWENNVDRAQLYVDRAVALNPVDFSGRLFQGALRLVRGETESSISSFKIALEARPTSSAAYTNLAVGYARLRNQEKALETIKRAIALNPLNSNALIILADLAHIQGVDCDAIPSLRYFVQFEQKNSAVWARLARALLEVRTFDESISALKRQASIQDSGEIWNNMGVAYFGKREYDKAFSSFNHAMTLDGKTRGRDFFLAARNAAIVLSKKASPTEVGNFVRHIVSFDIQQTIISDPVLSDLYSIYIYSLVQRNDVDEAIQFSEAILRGHGVALSLKIYAATGLLNVYSFRRELRNSALELAKSSERWLEHLTIVDVKMRDSLINNISYVYADNGLINAAERVLSKMTHLIHNAAYPTAVLGLINFRKGNAEKGVALYEEAGNLAFDRKDKIRIKQKQFIEMAIACKDENPRHAYRLIERARDYKDGDKELSQFASTIGKELKIGELPYMGF